MRTAAPLLPVLALALAGRGQPSGPPASSASPTSSDDPRFLPLAVKPGSPTRPLPGWDFRVLGPAGQPVRAGVDGAIVVKLPLPPGSLPTLWNDDDRYVASYLSAYDGYYLTGDSGHIDETATSM